MTDKVKLYDLFDDLFDICNLSVKDIYNLSCSCKKMKENFKLVLLYKKNLFLESKVNKYEETFSILRIVLQNYRCPNCRENIKVYPLYFWSNKLYLYDKDDLTI